MGKTAWDNGYIILPKTPDLGLEFNDASIAQMPYKGDGLHLEMSQHPVTP